MQQVQQQLLLLVCCPARTLFLSPGYMLCPLRYCSAVVAEGSSAYWISDCSNGAAVAIRAQRE